MEMLVPFVLYIALIVYVLWLANRFVSAVERIAEHLGPYQAGGPSKDSS